MDKYIVGQQLYSPTLGKFVWVVRINPNHLPTLYECEDADDGEYAFHEHELLDSDEYHVRYIT